MNGLSEQTIDLAFDGMTNTQLGRIYRQLYERLGDGGCYGWDYATMRIVHPGIYHSMRRLRVEFFLRGIGCARV